MTLCGKKFRETSGQDLSPEFPFQGIPQQRVSLNRDRLNHYGAFILVNLDEKWYLVKWIPHLAMYLQIELEFIEYIPYLDLKNEWKYQKELREWNKNSQTLRSN